MDTQEIQPGVMVDLDARGRVIGVEVLDFQARLEEEAEAQAQEAVQAAA